MKNILHTKFKKYFGDSKETIVSCAPGRVNLIGEHTDYNNGFVLPTTINNAIYLKVRKRVDRTCYIYSQNFQESTTFNLDHITKDPACHWADYIKGVMKILQDANYEFNGIEGVVYGDIPMGAGLSSSAALEIATINALQHLFALPLQSIEMIKLAQKAENIFVGMQCGIMDQFVSLLGKQNHALFIDCLNLTSENVPLNFTDHQLLIVDTKVKHELTKSAYNERRTQCETGVKYFNTIDNNITSLRNVTQEMFDQYGSKLSPIIQNRCRHIISENERVLQAVTSLRAGDMEKLGQLFYASHASLKNDYEISCKELDAIVDIAKEHHALGARMTGGGFGGSAIVLVSKKTAVNMQKIIHQKYQARFGFPPTIIILEKNLEATISK